jgi:hypothetical protein
MKSIFTLLFFAFYFSTTAQFGINTPWTWIKGDNTFNQPGDYGTKGVTVSTNKPSARSGSAVWKDVSGNIWIYSGNNYNDMWKYDPTTNNWTWMHGDNTANSPAVYGTLGLASANNTPGPIQNPIYWTDNTGKFWLYTGHLWKFDPQINQWTWVKDYNGSTNPGTRGGSTTWTDALGNLWLSGGSTSANDLWKYDIATNQWSTPGYVPGAPSVPRTNTTSWTDNAGNFWFFGGKYTFEFDMALNELWKFNPNTNQWIMVSGFGASSYGAKGITSSSNYPPGRFGASGWKDQSGNFWLFGGYIPQGCSTTCNRSNLNDLWKYDLSTHQWTWMKGDNILNTTGDYGSQGISSSTNKPGARSNIISFADNNGNFYLFGGNEVTNAAAPYYPLPNYVYSYGYFNDLWKISGTALPISLTSFTGRRIQKEVLLNWQTTNELNTSYFNVQRSFNGNSFTTIGKANAESNAIMNYSFNDKFAFENRSSIAFYRLEVIDNNGSKSYSSIVTVKNERENLIAITSNPVKTLLNIKIENDKVEEGKLIIRNIAGQLIKTESIQLSNGSNTKRLDVFDVPAGNYILTIVTSSQTTNQRFVKL